jgi:hypothetical protein
MEIIFLLIVCGAGLYYLNKKYPTDILSYDSIQWGNVNNQLICPHCQNKGDIRVKSVKRKKGVSGGKATAAILTLGITMLATGLSRKEGLTQAHCMKCNSTWDF